MGKVVFSYGEMSEASRQAGNTAKRLSSYADGLRKRVYNKLDGYSGEHTWNITQASRNVSRKIGALEQRAEELDNYSDAMKQLVKDCKETDSDVKKTVSNLTGSFKIRNDIQINPVWEAVCSIVTGVKNKTAVGRFISGLFEKGGNFFDGISRRIKVWYKYDGGKYFITENLKAALNIAIGVLGVVAGIATLIAGGSVMAIIGAIAGIVVGVFSAVNGLTDLINNCRAGAKAAEDPAEAQRLDGIESVSGALRTTDSQLGHNIALILDITETAAGIVSLTTGLVDFAKKGYSWFTNQKNLDLKTLKLSDVKNEFAHGGFKRHLNQRWNSFKNTAANIHSQSRNFISTLRSGNTAQIKQSLRTAFDFVKNGLKTQYMPKVAEQHIDAFNKVKGLKDLSTITVRTDKLKAVADGAKGISHFVKLGKGAFFKFGDTAASNLIFEAIATDGKNSISLNDIKSKFSTLSSRWKDAKGDVEAVIERVNPTGMKQETQNLYEHYQPGEINKAVQNIQNFHPGDLKKEARRLCDYYQRIPDLGCAYGVSSAGGR